MTSNIYVTVDKHITTAKDANADLVSSTDIGSQNPNRQVTKSA